MKISRIKVGSSSCGIAAGADTVLAALKEQGTYTVEAVGCIGHCYAEPLVEVECIDSDQTVTSVFYREVDADFALTLGELPEENRMFFDKKRTSLEKHLVTKNIGRINPVSLDEYEEVGGYEALKKALAISAENVVEDVKLSGLRGRGGGGFSTGMKWSFLAARPEADKVLICNADEGDPGAFMDRSLMEGLPHQVLEGMLIAAYATGTNQIFIYCRAEYPMAIEHLEIAIKQIEEAGLNVINGVAIPMIVKEGAGAFVCGEETALIHSLEGKRGMPRFRPPFPTERGYHDLPTMINNVETFANIPNIILNGVDAYRAIGTETSPGTKLFALVGDVPNPGLIEVPMGTTLRDIVCTIGGAKVEDLIAVQTGGPSGGCIPMSLIDTPVDYDSLNKLGAIMGSGGMIVIGNNRCMVETARYFLDFTHRESCGKCTFCRVGTKRMFETLERIVEGHGKPTDVDFLLDMGDKVKKGSLCGLGQTAPNPILATLRYFREDFDAHVIDKKCPAKSCNALVDIVLDKDACVKCGLCRKKACPVNAIDEDYNVDIELCTRCNGCIEICPKNAIERR